MHVYQSLLSIRTTSQGKFHDLTALLEQELEKSNIQDGILTVSALHTTAAISMQEPDVSVHQDAELVLNSIVPKNLNYKHIYEGNVNAAAHHKQLLIGNSKVIPVKDGSLVLGNWQRPFLVELFRPMTRKVFVTIVGIVT